MLTAARHPEVAAGLALWWISGGVFGLVSLGMHYCGQSLITAWEGGMEDVVAVPEWEEVLQRNPSNRQRFLDQDRQEFISTMERWMFVYCPCGDELVPGLPNADAQAIDIPALVFERRERRLPHAATSEAVAACASEGPSRRTAVGRSSGSSASQFLRDGRPVRALAAPPPRAAGVGPTTPSADGLCHANVAFA